MKTSPSSLSIGNRSFKALGEIWVAASPSGLLALEFPSTREKFSAALEKRFGAQAFSAADSSVLAALAQIGEYLAGTRREFSLPIDWARMTPFQQAALRETLKIPYGKTSSYAALAAALGKPRAARAVGRAEATNPLPLLIPCHRVLGADGKLHGYGAGEGLPTKTWLLNFEQSHC
ncbi:MAG: methylated-DNA--[protein]-cysteine S-methyltransferase [Anaerolineales bacterium]